ncbi:beta-1,4-glucuronyltransferase 1-like [Uloborus diversus]|uniref:beta-1,4-glucuronyltransferase 1-like n=1 Tax=Uloborus diversus TaxID=327109 RepID=UPI00240A5826|nr:beta-1,4-glucuronyltransferase 1-like [Uloborus diversus]
MTNMTALWRRVVILLVVVIAILQVIHMTLLSRLEARKNSNLRNGEKSDWQNHQDYQEAQLKKDMTRMLETIKQSSVLDSSGEYRIINFVMRAESFGMKNNVRQDLSLVTQSTIKHLVHLEDILDRWHGPVSVAIFSLTQDIPLAIDAILNLRRCVPAARSNASFHLVYPLNSPYNKAPSPQPLVLDPCETVKDRISSFAISDNYEHGVPYPNNLLRNVGRRNSLTDFVFVIDIDMVPSDNLYSDFMDFAVTNKLFIDSHKDDKTVYVVPAFEVKDGVEVPRDKTGLLQLLELMEARPFYFEMCWKCQKHTDYETWQKEPPSPKLNVLFEVLWRDPWEPFYIGRNVVPFYDERFRQYGFNRISQVCELHVSGYKFSVLNNAFIVHKGLKTPSSFHKDKDTDQEKNRQLFRQFKFELKEKYPDSSRKCY